MCQSVISTGLVIWTESTGDVDAAGEAAVVGADVAAMAAAVAEAVAAVGDAAGAAVGADAAAVGAEVLAGGLLELWAQPCTTMARSAR